MADCCEDQHPDHAAQIKRLNRLEGQLKGVRGMIEDRRYCPDILAQTRAVGAALKSLESEILASHLDNCVRTAFASGDEAVAEKQIQEITTLFRKA